MLNYQPHKITPWEFSQWKREKKQWLNFLSKIFPFLHTDYDSPRFSWDIKTLRGELIEKYGFMCEAFSSFFSFLSFFHALSHKSPHFDLLLCSLRFPVWNVFDFNSTLFFRPFFSFSFRRKRQKCGRFVSFFSSFVVISCLAFACYEVYCMWMLAHEKKSQAIFRSLYL